MNPYEKGWVVSGIIMSVAFLSIVGYFGFSAGLQPPQKAKVIDSTKIAEDPRFSNPRVEEVVPRKEYNVYLVARMWTFIPNQIEVPRGAKINFYITSPDVVHGFQIVGTSVQSMVILGYVTEISARFNEPGQYWIICNEYCGQGHHMMKAKLIVKGGVKK